MDNLNQEQKGKLVKYVEFILEPINGKFDTFDVSHDICISIKPLSDSGNIISEENKTTVYPMKVKTDLGEITVNFWSDQDPEWSITKGCAQNKAIIPDKNWQEIINREKALGNNWHKINL